MDIFNWSQEVKEVNRYLDETYTVNIAGKGVAGAGRVAWGRIGVEKFYARVIPQILGSRDAKRLTPTIRMASHDAICYGNSTILVFDSGDISVSDPLQSMATRNRFGHVIFESYRGPAPLTPAPLPDLVGANGILMARVENPEPDEDPYIPVGRCFTIFFKHGKHGESRITPAIRKSILAQARTELRIEEGENFYIWPQRILNGVWDEFLENRELTEAVQKVVTGVREVLAIPANPDNGQKVDVESWAGGDFTKSVTIKESRIKDVAAAFNIDAQELGFTSSQFSSAEAIYTAKEDLMLEIQEFTANATDPIEDFLDFAQTILGFKFEAFHWADPATPSIGSRADYFIKLSKEIPGLKYSKAALMEMNLLSPAVLDDIFEEVDREKMIRLAIESQAAQLEGDIANAGGE